MNLCKVQGFTKARDDYLDKKGNFEPDYDLRRKKFDAIYDQELTEE